MIPQAIMNPSAEMGTIQLEGVPTGLAARLANIDRSLASWVMTTKGRFPLGEAEAAGRDTIARASSGIGLLTNCTRERWVTTLTTRPLSWYLAADDGLTQNPVFPGRYYGQTNLTIEDCVGLVAGDTFLHIVRRGPKVASGPDGPTFGVVNLDDNWHDPLELTQWTAYAFDAAWEVLLTEREGIPWPSLNIAPAATLWGSEASTDIVVSPVLDQALVPRPGSKFGTNAPRILKADIAQTVDGEGKVSKVWATPSEGNSWTASPYGTASKDFVGPQHPNGLGPLGRDTVSPTRVEDTSAAQLTSTARSMLTRNNLATLSWTVEMTNNSDAEILPLGAPVAVFDPDVGVASDGSDNLDSGVQGADPLRGFRVSERTPPFDPEHHGLYIVWSDAWGDVTDLTPYARKTEGSATIRLGTQVGFSARASLRRARKA